MYLNLKKRTKYTALVSVLLIFVMLFSAACKDVTVIVPSTEKYTPDYSALIKVTDNGAKGDGSTDDTAAILATIQAAKAVCEDNAIYFPDGTYKISGNIEFPQMMSFVFSEKASLIIDKSASVSFLGTVNAGEQLVFGGEGEIKGMLSNSYVYPQWFGAKGDGETDDSDAFRTALSHSNELAVPATQKGYVLNTVTVNTGKKIYGSSEEKSLIIGTEDCKDMFIFPDGAQDIIVENLSFDMGKTGESSCFFFNSTSVPNKHITINAIETSKAYYVVRDARSDPSKLFITNIQLADFNCKNTRNSVIYTLNFWGFIFLKDMVLDNSGIKEACNVDGNYPAIDFAENEGGIIQNITIIGTDNSENINENGFLYTTNIATWMKDCKISNVGGDGIKAVKGQHLYFSDITVEKAYGNGMSFDTIYHLQCGNINIAGRNKESNKGADGAGLYFKSNLSVMLNNINVKEMSGNGILLEGTKYCASSNIVSENNAKNGYFDMGNYNTCANITATGNGMKQVVLASDDCSLTGGDNGKEKFDLKGKGEK